MTYRTYSARGVIADGTFDLSSLLGKLMGEQYATGVVSVTLYDSAAYDNAVNASAGTLTITASEDGFNFGSIDNNIIDLTDPAYERPSFRALVTDLNCVWAGVTGATHFEIRCWRATD